MSFSIARSAALAAAGCLALVTTAAAAATGPYDGRSCFYSSQWDGWSAPDTHTLLLKVNINDIYKVTLTGDNPQIQWSGVHLVSIVRGTSNVCTALDLDLKIAMDNRGLGATPLIARSLTKLTPEEVAAIPKKYRP